jgi:hypothetical protein
MSIFRPPKGCRGVYHWGTWFEQGQTERGPIWSKDYRAGRTHSGVSDGAYAARLRQQLMWSLGNMTRAVDLLFRIVDNSMREQYHTGGDARNGTFENRHYIETRCRFGPETMHRHSSGSQS